MYCWICLVLRETEIHCVFVESGTKTLIILLALQFNELSVYCLVANAFCPHSVILPPALLDRNSNYFPRVLWRTELRNMDGVCFICDKNCLYTTRLILVLK